MNGESQIGSAIIQGPHDQRKGLDLHEMPGNEDNYLLLVLIRVTGGNSEARENHLHD